MRKSELEKKIDKLQETLRSHSHTFWQLVDFVECLSANPQLTHDVVSKIKREFKDNILTFDDLCRAKEVVRVLTIIRKQKKE